MKEKFTKKDLKNLMVVEMRNGWKAVVIDDELVGKDGYMQLDGYDDNLKRIRPADTYGYDIVKVWEEYCGLGAGFNTYIDDVNKDSILIWERKEKKEKKEIKLTTEERAFLNSILLVSNYKYIARDEKENKLYVYKVKPSKGCNEWVYCLLDRDGHKNITEQTKNMFKFITWDDDEPYLIEDLLKL